MIVAVAAIVVARRVEVALDAAGVFVGAFVVGAAGVACASCISLAVSRMGSVVEVVANTASFVGATSDSFAVFRMGFVVEVVVALVFGSAHHKPLAGPDSAVVFLSHGSSLCVDYWSGRGLRGPLPRFPPSLFEKSFMAVPFVCWVFANHMENGREVFWKMGKGRRRD